MLMRLGSTLLLRSRWSLSNELLLIDPAKPTAMSAANVAGVACAHGAAVRYIGTACFSAVRRQAVLLLRVI